MITVIALHGLILAPMVAYPLAAAVGWNGKGSLPVLLGIWFVCLLALHQLHARPWVIRRRRLRRGLCENCGYDLRASSERCPECGTPISRAASDDG